MYLPYHSFCLHSAIQTVKPEKYVLYAAGMLFSSTASSFTDVARESTAVEGKITPTHLCNTHWHTSFLFHFSLLDHSQSTPNCSNSIALPCSPERLCVPAAAALGIFVANQLKFFSLIPICRNKNVRNLHWLVSVCAVFTVPVGWTMNNLGRKKANKGGGAGNIDKSIISQNMLNHGRHGVVVVNTVASLSSIPSPRHFCV